MHPIMALPNEIELSGPQALWEPKKVEAHSHYFNYNGFNQTRENRKIVDIRAVFFIIVVSKM